MKRFLLALALLLVPAAASAQCNGIFPNNTVCGNVTGAGNLPRATSPSAFIGAAGGSNGQVQINSAGALAGITNTQLTALLNAFTSTLSGAVPASGGGTVNFLRADGSFVAPPGTGLISGTPVVNQIAQWTGATAIQGVNLSSLLIAGAGISLSGTTTVTINNSFTSATLQANPANPTGTASATQLMMGLGVTTCRVTPTQSGRMRVGIQGTMSANALGTLSVAGRWGTGAGPANGTAISGNALTNTTIQGTIQGATSVLPFRTEGIITGLTLGTAIWIDVSMGTNSGTASLLNINCDAQEF